jgi:hypothetical protein
MMKTSVGTKIGTSTLAVASTILGMQLVVPQVSISHFGDG